MSLLVPYQELDPAVLRRLCESFIVREGTDYGLKELSLDDKLEALLTQITAGEVVITFDADTESVNLMTKVDYQNLGYE